jgi:hypothetical protein
MSSRPTRRLRRVAAPVWSELAQAQAGLVGRHQLLDLGVSPGRIGALLDAGTLHRRLPGVYSTRAGPATAAARSWAAVLYAGPSSMPAAGPSSTPDAGPSSAPDAGSSSMPAAGPSSALAGTWALWLWGVLPMPPDVVTVCIPHCRRVRPQPGLQIVVSRQLGTSVHPAALPRRLRLEVALLDVVDASTDAGRVIDLVLRATQGRHTTPARIAQTLAARSRHRWRGLLRELLAEVEGGVQSPLERRWLHMVERPHGLPPGERNHPERVVGERVASERRPAGARPVGERRLPGSQPQASGARRPVTRYRDVRYRPWRVVVELDGREAHPDDARFRDRLRDNAVAAGGEVALRYGWRETVADPCGVAAEVVRVLRRQGWPGTPRRCGAGCAVIP